MIEQRVTTYEWASSVNDSVSYKKVDGQTVQTNLAVNPKAEGAVVGLSGGAATVSLVADSTTGGGGTQSYKAVTSDATSYASASTKIRPGGEAVPGQKYWGRCRLRMDGQTIGGRRMLGSLRYYNSAGTLLGYTDGTSVDLLPTGTFRRWTSTANASTSEEFNGLNKRTNMATDPHGTRLASLDGWSTGGYGTGGAGTQVVDALGASDGGSAVTTTWTTAATSGGAQIQHMFTVPSAAANAISASMDVRVNQDLPNVYLGVGTGVGTTVSLKANTVTRLTVTGGTSPAGQTSLNVFFRIPNLTGSGVVAGTTITTSRAIVEYSSTVGDYFDGSTVTPLGGRFRYWAGTANASWSREANSDGTFRTNFASDPAATSTTVPSGKLGWTSSRWFGPGGANGQYSLVTGAGDGPVGLTTYVRKTWQVASTGSGDTGFNNTPSVGFPVAPNTSYAISSYLRSSSARSVASIQIKYYDLAGNPLSANGYDVAGTNTPLVAGTWTRLTAVGTTPANAAVAVIMSDVDGSEAWAVGDTLDGTGLLVEQSSSIGSYFDGSEVWPQAGKYRVWAGTAEASPSIETSPDGSTRSNLVVSPNYVNGWNVSRATRVVGSGGVVLTTSEVGYFPRIVSSSLPVIPGQVYTISAQVRQAGTHQIGVQYLTASGNAISNPTAPGSLATRSTTGTLSLTTAAAPSNAASVQIWLGMPDNSPIGTTASFGPVLMEQSATTGAYFDGSTADSALVLPQMPTGRINTSVVELTASGTAPASAAYVTFQAQRTPIGSAAATGDTFYVDNIMLTDSTDTTAPAYFDGNFPQEITYVNVPRPGEITTDEWVEIDDVPLNTYAYNVTTWGGNRQSPPAVRGANLTVPGRPGTVFMRKELDAQDITLNMWVQGTDTRGVLPTTRSQQQQFDKNWRMLRKLLFQVRREMTIVKRWVDEDSGAVRSAKGKVQYNGGLEPQMTGRARALFSVNLLMNDPFFYETPRELDVATTTQKTWQEEVDGDWRTTAINVSIPGPRVNPRITVTDEDGNVTWVKYTGTIANGETLFLDVNSFSAKIARVGGTLSPVAGNISHDGDKFWLVLEPGNNTILLESTSGTSPVSLSYSAVWF